MTHTITATQSVRAAAVQAVERNPALSAAELARTLRKDVGEERLLDFALEQIERVIVRERRRAVRQIEASSETGRADSEDRWRVVEELLEEYRQEVIVDWTAELLGSEFALGDGTRATWADATVVQHKARMAMLERNVRGNLDAICRHEAAITTIEKAGKQTLGEAVR
jgi:hypothetical protein